MMRDNIPVFTEVPEREITAAPGQGYNFILEGDNLHSLRLLEKTHKGKIDIIYIDPPYNRGGNDFRYEDTFVEKQDVFRHSKWLSFMESRLCIAWQLLKSDGVIFISIDDFEMGALRMLCDDVLGETFFLCNIVWQKRYSRENREAIGDAHEYILVYAKDPVIGFRHAAGDGRNGIAIAADGDCIANGIFKPGGLKECLERLRHAALASHIKRIRRTDTVQRKVDFVAFALDEVPDLQHKLKFKENRHLVPMSEEQAKVYKNPNNDPKGGIHYPPEGRCWSTIEPEFKKLLAQGRIYFGKNNDSQPNTIRYLSEVEGVVPSDCHQGCILFPYGKSPIQT